MAFGVPRDELGRWHSLYLWGDIKQALQHSILRISRWPDVPLYCPCAEREARRGVRLGRGEEGSNDQPHMWSLKLQRFHM